MNESDLRDLLPPERPLPAASRQRVRQALAGEVRRGRRRARWAIAATATAAAACLAVGVVVADGGTDRSTVRSAAPPDGGEPEPANGQVPGRAVVTEPDTLRTYDGSGRQTGTTTLAPLESIGAVASDLDGGWLACGQMPPGAVASRPELREHVARASEDEPWDVARGNWLVWFPRGREPVVLVTGIEPDCGTPGGAVQVVDSPEGPTAIYRSRGFSEAELATHPIDEAILGWHAFVLATGADRALGIPRPTGPFGAAVPPWSAATGRMLVQDTGGLELYDLATEEARPMAPLDVLPRTFQLSPDGRTVAMLTVPLSGPAEVTVRDLATGAERFRHEVGHVESSTQLSYDGSTIAVAVDDRDVAVVDVATGAVRTLPVTGVLG